jgi:hypothetical protein
MCSHTPYDDHHVGQAFPGLQQLISYALAQPAFAARLVHDAEHAIMKSSHGIKLTEEERTLVTQVRDVDTLVDFAATLQLLMQERVCKRNAGIDHTVET